MFVEGVRGRRRVISRLPAMTIMPLALATLPVTFCAASESGAATATLPAKVLPFIGKERTIPDEARPFVSQGGVVIAFAEVEAQQGARTMALAIRTPRTNQPADIDPWDADYTCDLIVLQSDGGQVRMTGRSSRAVACRGNLLNPNIGTRALDSNLELREAEVTFRNLGDTAFKGTASYSFHSAGGVWHLSAAKSVYSSYRPGGVAAHIEESISYPKDFGLIPMEDFDPDAIDRLMSKSARIIE